MVFHENRLPADDSHEISYFEKAAKFATVVCCKLYRWRFKGLTQNSHASN